MRMRMWMWRKVWTLQKLPWRPCKLRRQHLPTPLPCPAVCNAHPATVTTVPRPVNTTTAASHHSPRQRRRRSRRRSHQRWMTTSPSCKATSGKKAARVVAGNAAGLSCAAVCCTTSSGRTVHAHKAAFRWFRQWTRPRTLASPALCRRYCYVPTRRRTRSRSASSLSPPAVCTPSRRPPRSPWSTGWRH